jgi:4-carboxymuconolactone decarboxylase
MTRIPTLPPEDMSPEQEAFARTFTSGPRASADAAFPLSTPDGRLIGPPAIWILQPRLGMALQHLGGEVRFGLLLGDRAAEAAVLAIAEHEHSPFELFAHVRAAAKAGWSDEDIAVIRAGGTPPGATEEESAALEIARSMLIGPLEDGAADEALRRLGAERLMELTTLVGYYRMLAAQLAIFGIEPPEIVSER